MKSITLSNTIPLGPGTKLTLTAEQFEARAHIVTVLKDGKAGTLVELLQPTQFKAGETIVIDEEALPKGVRALATAAPAEPAPTKEKGPSAKALDKARAEGVAAGRAAMFAEVEAYNTLLDAVDAAQEKLDTVLADASADDAAKVAAQNALQDAQAAADAAKPAP